MKIGTASDILMYAFLFHKVLPFGLCVYKSHSDLWSDVSEEGTASILSVAKTIQVSAEVVSIYLTQFTGLSLEA
jgi:hypothetical protein